MVSSWTICLYTHHIEHLMLGTTKGMQDVFTHSKTTALLSPFTKI